MYHLRLCKALSYSGVVSATQQQPDVFTEDKATADAAVATGYFALVEEEGKQKTRKLDKGQFKDWKMDELKKLAESMGVDVSACKKKQDIIDAICSEEAGYSPKPVDDEDEGDDSDDSEAEDEGSPTMIELQKE